ncbi:hypothetical protein BDZ45DRAFT_503667 [Acephala macrosclerotiorum]|nr:hypothetical protein BDZ45DRAFT_503667 [Acephala macrosclerotiorum]
MKSNQLFFFTFATRATAALDSSLCFYPDGITTEPTHSPCNLTVSASSCCDPLDACTASGLCLGRTGFNYRGTCTDKTWDSSNCAASCHADPFNNVAYNEVTPLWSCDKPGAPETNYCCNSPTRNCCTIATFAYGTTGIAFKTGMDQMLLELASLSSSGNVTVTVTATGGAATRTEASSNSANSAETSSSSSSNLGAAIGAGVGVPMGILSLGILGFLFWRERRHSQYNSQQAQSRTHIMEMDPPKTYYTPPPPPPLQPQQPYVPVVEAPQGQAGVSRMSPQKLPAYGARPSDIHELI